MILGITGPARSGKNTIANHLVSKHKYLRQSFADPPRRFVANLLGLHFADLVGGPLKERPIEWLDGKSPRQMMQTLGDDWGRDLIHPELWIRVALRKACRTLAMHPGTNIVFPAVHSDHEASAIRAAGGVILHVTRPGFGVEHPHPGEQCVTERPDDLHARNHGSMARLWSQANDIAKIMLIRAPTHVGNVPVRKPNSMAEAMAMASRRGMVRPVEESE